MNDKFALRLTEYLNSECSDFDLSYTWEWNDGMQYCEVDVKRECHENRNKTVCFKYNEKNDDLLIELSEDSFYVTREFDQTVKYFWMLVAPALFHN